MERFNFPEEDIGLRALLKPEDTSFKSNLNNRGYIKSLPKDPWGNEYQYLFPGEYGEYDLFSLGADGEQGGEGINADIGNWDPEIE